LAKTIFAEIFRQIIRRVGEQQIKTVGRKFFQDLKSVAANRFVARFTKINCLVEKNQAFTVNVCVGFA
jgi:hypothetical protein